MNEFTDERDALLVLNALPNIGPITLNRLLAELGGDARDVFSASAERLQSVKGVGPAIANTILNWKDSFDLARERQRMEASRATFITTRDLEYPKLLKEIHDPPIGLYRKGGYAFTEPCIAVVGSRRTTLYGQGLAKSVAGELARLGFCIVSGLARGIDTAAHEGALASGGKTAAVVGSGIDIVYPPENLELYRQIEEAGAILSEFPFGRRADRQSFPMRNRVVAGMCDATIVVETDVNGGSMITARFAAEQGRLVFAVPGRIDQASSHGCHQLIRDGAILFTCVDDVLEELSYLNGLRPQAIPEKPAYTAGPNIGELTDEEAAVYNCFDGGDIIDLDTIASRTSLRPCQVASTLMMLELKRLVAKRADGRFEAIRG